MVPDNLKYGGGVGGTFLHPIVAVAMVIIILMMLALPRKYLSIPLLASAILIPMGQVVVLGGLHLFVLRIVLIFALVRVAASLGSDKPAFSGGFNTLDKLFITWAFLHVVTFVLQFMAVAAIINQGSYLLDVLGGYIVIRFSIQDEEDSIRAVKTLALSAVVVAIGMLDEKFHNQNMFGLLGHFVLIPGVRDGSIRAQGPFLHPLLAGSFGATLLALCIWLWHVGKSKTIAVLGIIGCTVIILTSASSTPVMAYASAIFALCLWPLRKDMRTLRWGLVAVIAMLAVVMKAPVWFVISHIDLTGSSSGYHRALVIDQFIRHFNEWWLIGTNNNSNWGFDMWDTENTFVAEGQQGGILTFVVFIAMVCVCFRWIGNARKAVEGDQAKEFAYWILGAALFSHVVAYFGIVYFDHMFDAWLTLLAIICVTKSPEALVASAVPVKSKKLSLTWPATAPVPQPSPFGTVRTRQTN